MCDRDTRDGVGGERSGEGNCMTWSISIDPRITNRYCLEVSRHQDYADLELANLTSRSSFALLCWLHGPEPSS